MSFTIYTVGDPSTLGSALNGLALFFGQESWVASLLQTGLMISLLLILAKGVTREGLRLDVMLLQLIVTWALFIPKTSVMVEQFDNAAPPIIVDNIPYAIAVPASLAGSFAYYMTSKLETAMSTVDGNYFSVTGGEHPFTPARMLLSFAACPQDPLKCIDQNLAETLRNAARYCAGPSLSQIRFDKVSNVLKSFAETMTGPGQTVVYTDDHPYRDGGGSGISMSCDQAKSYLGGIATSIEAGNFLSFKPAVLGRLNYAATNRYSANDRAKSGVDVDVEDSLGLINRVTDNIGKIDYVALTNVMSYSIAESLKYNAGAPIDQQVSINRDRSLFEWAQNEANASLLVTASAPKFMDVLFFIFIASTPLVMFVFAANPASGMKVIGSYILFGIWTQSWIPVMAIVMAWYQTEIQNFNPPVGGVVSVEYVAQLMRHVMTSTIAAGNMIQNAPYITFAILAGSMFALSNMIGRAMPSGGGSSASDEGGQTGYVKDKGGSPVPGGTLGRLQAAMGGRMALSSGSLGNAPITGDVVTELGSASQTYSFDAGIARGLEATNQMSIQSQAQATRSLAQAFNKMFNVDTSGGVTTQGGNETSGGSTKTGTDGMKVGLSNRDFNGNSAALGVGASSENATRTSQEIRAGIKATLPLLRAAKDELDNEAASAPTPEKRMVAEKAATEIGAAIKELEANGGDAKKAAETGERLAKSVADHDSKAGKDMFGIIDFLKSGALGLHGDAQFGAGASQTDGQSAKLGIENKNGNETSLSRNREAGVQTDVRFQSGSFFRQGGDFSQRGSEVLQALTQAQTSLQSSRTATDLNSSATKLMASLGAKGGVNLNQADIAQRFGHMMTINNSGRDVSLGEAKDIILSAVSGVFGGNGNALEDFQRRMNDEAARFAQNNHLGMNNNQIAAAAAFGALGDMMRSDNVAVSTQAAAGVARMIEMAGMNPGVDSKELAKLGTKLQEQMADIEQASSGMLNRVGDAVPTTENILNDMGGVEREAKQRMGEGSGLSASGRAAANAYQDKSQQFGDAGMGQYNKEGAIAIGPTGRVTPDQIEGYLGATDRQGLTPTDGSGVNYVQGGSGSGVNQVFNEILDGVRGVLGSVPGGEQVLKYFPQDQGGSTSNSGAPSSVNERPQVNLGSGSPSIGVPSTPSGGMPTQDQGAPSIGVPSTPSSGGSMDSVVTTVETRTEVGTGGLPEIGLNSGGGSSATPVVISSQDMNAAPSASINKPNQDAPSSRVGGGGKKQPLPGRG